MGEMGKFGFSGKEKAGWDFGQNGSQLIKAKTKKECRLRGIITKTIMKIF